MAEPAPTRDARLTPARPDLAAERLRGVVDAPRYAPPRALRATTPTVPLTDRPDADAPMTTELLFGEPFDVYDSRDGWVWGQSGIDGYVGYAPAPCLGPAEPAPTDRVVARHALIYAAPAVKARPVGALPFGALVAAGPAEGGFRALAAGGFMPAPHLAALDAARPADWVAVAESLLGAPYLWGGRSAAGVDCSGLVQVARQAAGFACLRDSDMQREAPGEAVAPGAERRGDLICWRGHIGIMTSAADLLHANAHHMAVAVEPLAQAEARIAAAGFPVLARRRWTA
jgi:cell wall-associated NlpC family hydrolase